MKRLLLLLLLLPSLAWGSDLGQEYARMNPYILGGGAGESLSCSGATVQQTENGTNDQVTAFRYTSPLASQFVYSGTTGTLCRIDMRMNKEGSPTQVVTASIYNDSAGAVGTSAGSCTGTFNAATLGGSFQTVTFSGCNISLTNGTTYWIHLQPDGADVSNYVWIQTDTSCTTEKLAYNDGSWQYFDTTQCWNFSLYILE